MRSILDIGARRERVGDHRDTPHVSAAEVTVPWYIWCVLLSGTCNFIGLQWDISWHISIGRDAFWTLPHIAIYMCPVLCSIACGYLILSSTLRRGAYAGKSVRILGLYGPFGAFIGLWRSAVMLTSAPFDNWWHNAYGLDVKIISPPHAVLVLGMCNVQLGALTLVLSQMNRAEGAAARKLRPLVLYAGSAILILLMTLVMEYVNRYSAHTSLFYQVVSLTAPLALITTAIIADHKWSASILAAAYMSFLLAMLWILPLFPAEPKLGPVYQRVTHFIPPAGFPVLLIVPAVLIDCLRRRLSNRSKWLQAAAYGPTFVIALLLVQWPLARFLLSPAGGNRIFGGHYYPYDVPLDSPTVHGQFIMLDRTAGQFWMGVIIATSIASAASRIAIGFGGWMRTLRR
jgi:hypothetical protein